MKRRRRRRRRRRKEEGEEEEKEEEEGGGRERSANARWFPTKQVRLLIKKKTTICLNHTEK